MINKYIETDDRQIMGDGVNTQMIDGKIDNYEMKANTSVYSFQNVMGQDPMSDILTYNKI